MAQCIGTFRRPDLVMVCQQDDGPPCRAHRCNAEACYCKQEAFTGFAPMVGFVEDDGGRKVAGYKGRAGDCVTRAFCILTGQDYRTAYRELANANAKYGRKRERSARNGVNKAAYERVFKAAGLVKVKLPRGPRPTYSEAHARYGDCLVSTTRHIAAIVGGNYRDTFDDRTYKWRNEYDEVEIRERKAQSVWVKQTA